MTAPPSGTTARSAIATHTRANVPEFVEAHVDLGYLCDVTPIFFLIGIEVISEATISTDAPAGGGANITKLAISDYTKGIRLDTAALVQGNIMFDSTISTASGVPSAAVVSTSDFVSSTWCIDCTFAS